MDGENEESKMEADVAKSKRVSAKRVFTRKVRALRVALNQEMGGKSGLTKLKIALMVKFCEMRSPPNSQ